MTGYGYGVWLLVVVNSAIFIIFAASFFHPRSMRDWKAMGAFSSFVVALNGRDVRLSAHHLLLVGMARYFLSGWLGSRFDSLTLTHNGGHLWSELLGWQGDPHLSPFHLVSYVFIGAGFWAIAAAWPVLLRAARDGELATTGLYARVRHPQYVGFLVIRNRLCERRQHIQSNAEFVASLPQKQRIGGHANAGAGDQRRGQRLGGEVVDPLAQSERAHHWDEQTRTRYDDLRRQVIKRQ